MNEKWEMCIIHLRRKTTYSSDGMTTEELSLEERDETIRDLLSSGWEPFAADTSPSSWNLYFRRRVS